MRLGRRSRQVTLIAHITVSVGWLGAVLVSLALAVVALGSADPETVQAVYVALELTGWYVLVPMSVASLVTGLVQGLGSAWGVLRHYWVVLKLLMNLFATGVLLLYMQQLDHLADAATTPGLAPSGVLAVADPSPVVHSAAALVLLLVAATLSVVKPRGLTPYGLRLERERRL